MPSWKHISGRRKLAIGAGVVAVLALVGVLVTLIFPRGDAADPEPSAARTAPASVKQLELGEVATISPDYKVAVTKVTIYRGSNTPFVAATVKARYTGTGEGEPWSDLLVEFAGSGDSRSFGSSTCPIDLDEAVDAPTLSSGDIGTFAACSTLAASRVKGGTVSVIDSSLRTDQRYFWSTTGAVTKTLPKIDPLAALPTAGQPVAGQPPAADYSSNAGCDDFDKDEYEDYKESGQKFKEYVDANRRYYDDDDLDEYDDWKKKFDQQIKYLKKVDEACS